MREGWICPQCKRGVSPDVKTCDHDVAGQIETARRFLEPTVVPGTTVVPPGWRWPSGTGDAVLWNGPYDRGQISVGMSENGIG